MAPESSPGGTAGLEHRIVSMLLERETALASLAEYARDAGRGEGRLVLIAGEPGAGKTTLVEQLEADRPEANWSWGACDGLFTPRPLAPLFDLADQLGGELLRLCRSRAPRDELFGAVLRQITEAERLHAIVIEDLHWADEATIDLLRFLGRRLRNAPVLLLVTYRDGGSAANDPLRLALGELATQRSTRRIDLAPLSERAVATLADGSGLDGAELFRLTSGNPFYVTEVIRGGMAEVPRSARDAALARVARLSDGSREVLDVAALTGTRVELRLLRAATACTPESVDDLLASGLLVDDGAYVRFQHEIARLAIEQAIPTHRSSLIQARILAALGELDCDDDARMAFHAEAAGDTAAVLRHAPVAAAHSSAVASHREAAAQLERALRFATGIDDAALAHLYERYAYEASVLDRWEDAAAAGERALALWRAADDQVRAGDMLRQLSRTMWRLCRSDDATATATEAVAVLEPLGPSVELAWAYANLANQYALGRATDATIRLTVPARTLAEDLDVPAVLVEVLNTHACATYWLDPQWDTGLRRGLKIAVAAGLHAQAGRSYTNLYGIYSRQRRYAEAESFFVEGLAYCDERDMGTYTTCLSGERTNMMEKTGRWDESIALGTELLRRVASPINRLNPLISVGVLRARRGETAAAWAYLDEAQKAADGCREPEWITPMRLARVEAYWLEGRSAEAVREAECAADLADRCEVWERGAIAVWLRRTGSTLTVDGEMATPYRLMIGNDPAGAAAAWTDLGCPYDAALALLDGSDADDLRAALRAFDDLGAAAAARITRQRMRGLGIRSIPSGAQTTTRKHPRGLTRREQDVLDLIRAGHTNAEIAAKLFISAKTVDHHVSAVLGKLDVPTRAAAAAEAERLAL